MTLIELTVSAAIGTLLSLGLVALVIFSNRSFAGIANYVALDQQSRLTLDTMTREIRQVNRLTGFTEASLTFEDHDGSVLSYSYDAQARALKRTKNGQTDSKPLLTQCDFLKFSIFQRNPVGASYDQYPSASVSACKLVQLQWKCSREILGSKVNTESVQSAKIVIRNH